MKNLIALLIAGVTTSAIGQTARDFTLIDLDGRDRNLYSTLDNDTVVVLKFLPTGAPFATIPLTRWWDFTTSTCLRSALPSGQLTDRTLKGQLDQHHSATIILLSVFAFGESVANSFGVQYQPEYKIVCDRSIEEEVSYTQVDQHVQTCLAQIGVGINDQTLEGSFFFIRKTVCLIFLESILGCGSKVDGL